MKKLALLIILLPSSLLAADQPVKHKELYRQISKQVRTGSGTPLYHLAVLEYLINQKERK